MKRLIQTPLLVQSYCIKYFRGILNLAFETDPFLIHANNPLGVEWCWRIVNGEIRYCPYSNTCSFSHEKKDFSPCWYRKNDRIEVYPAELSYGDKLTVRAAILELTSQIEWCTTELPLIEWDEARMKKTSLL